MDVEEKLDELTQLVEEAKAMPLSASCIVNRAQVLDLLDEIRSMLPDSLHEANSLLSDRERVVADGQREAEAVLADAQREQARLVSEHEVYLAAVHEAQQVRDEAYDEAERVRREVDDYVDHKLANFEVVLQKTLQTVERGRDKIRGRQAYDELGDQAQEPLPR